MLHHAILTAGGVFLATAILLPLDRHYRAWKAARGEVTLRRDTRGRLVPDLRVKRAERSVLVLIAFVIALGLAGAYSIMS